MGAPIYCKKTQYFSVYLCLLTKSSLYESELKVQFFASMGQKNHTKIQETLNMVVFSLQRAKNQRLTHADMAKLVGVSKRTFSEWMRDGGAAPVAMKAIISMLSMLPREDVLKIVENWRHNQPSSANSNQDRGEANEQKRAYGRKNGRYPVLQSKRKTIWGF